MKMKSKSKIVISVCLGCILLVLIGYRYHAMNFGIPQKFKNEVVFLNEVIKLDSTDIKVTDFKLTSDKDTNIINISLSIINTDNKDVNIYDLIYHSKVVYKNTLIEIPRSIEGNGDNIVKPNNKKSITLSYNFPYAAVEENFKFYPSKKLYEQQVKDYLEKHLLMYEKAIEVNYGGVKE